MDLEDMVFQGIVLGPILWNLFFGDARVAIEAAKFLEIIYADDLNAFRIFGAGESDDVVFASIRVCQGSLHKWGLLIK